MIDARFRPIDKWPSQRTPPGRRRQAIFRANYTNTLDLLEHELRHLHARDIVIQAGFALDQIRNDGWPRSAARPGDPGVILSFRVPKLDQGSVVDGRSFTELAFPCDRYTGWEDNLRAIALSLQALRAVDRYGVTQHAEQYKGWRQLPPANSVSEVMSRQDAARFITEHSGIFVSHEHTDRAVLQDAYRLAARKLHPDAGGDHELFVNLQTAKQVLEKDR